MRRESLSKDALRRGSENGVDAEEEEEEAIYRKICENLRHNLESIKAYKKVNFCSFLEWVVFDLSESETINDPLTTHLKRKYYNSFFLKRNYHSFFLDAIAVIALCSYSLQLGSLKVFEFKTLLRF